MSEGLRGNRPKRAVFLDGPLNGRQEVLPADSPEIYRAMKAPRFDCNYRPSAAHADVEALTLETVLYRHREFRVHGSSTPIDFYVPVEWDEARASHRVWAYICEAVYQYQPQTSQVQATRP